MLHSYSSPEKPLQSSTEHKSVKLPTGSRRPSLGQLPVATQGPSSSKGSFVLSLTSPLTPYDSTGDSHSDYFFVPRKAASKLGFNSDDFSDIKQDPNYVMVVKYISRCFDEYTELGAGDMNDAKKAFGEVVKVEGIKKFFIQYYQTELLRLPLYRINGKLHKSRSQGANVMTALLNAWDAFYSQTLPLLQFVINDERFNSSPNFDFRSETIANFARVVISTNEDFKREVQGICKDPQGRTDIMERLRSMFLVLLMHEPPDEDADGPGAIEELCSPLVKPLIGSSGKFYSAK